MVIRRRTRRKLLALIVFLLIVLALAVSSARTVRDKRSGYGECRKPTWFFGLFFNCDSQPVEQ